MQRVRSVVSVLLLSSATAIRAAADSETAAPAKLATDSVATRDSSRVVASATAPHGAAPRSPAWIPSLAWSVGVGAPAFPQRDRFRAELDAKVLRDSLVIDQPWDGSQLGFSTGMEVAVQHDFLRPTAGAVWSFWDGRSVHRDTRTGELFERTWRVDQLMGQVGLDALLPRRLLTVNSAQAPYFGFRAAYGLGRLEGMGRAWARGGGWEAHVGADVVSAGPFVLSGRFGWTSLALRSTSPTSRVLYDGVGSDNLRWSGSGLWLDLVVRLRPRPALPDTLRAKPAPADTSRTKSPTPDSTRTNRSPSDSLSAKAPGQAH